MWQELKNMKDIMLVAQTPAKKKNIGKRSIIDAKNFSEFFYNENMESSSPALAGIYNIELFTIESVLHIVPKIREALIKEMAVIETEIEKLSNNFDISQTDDHGLTKKEQSVPKLKLDTKVISSGDLKKKSSFKQFITTSLSKVSTTKGFEDDHYFDESLNGAVAGNDVLHTQGKLGICDCKSSNQLSSPSGNSCLSTSKENGLSDRSSCSSGSSSSRFRSRLDSARHELHLLDELDMI